MCSTPTRFIKANENMHNETIFYGQQLEKCPAVT